MRPSAGLSDPLGGRRQNGHIVKIWNFELIAIRVKFGSSAREKEPE